MYALGNLQEFSFDAYNNEEPLNVPSFTWGDLAVRNEKVWRLKSVHRFAEGSKGQELRQARSSLRWRSGSNFCWRGTAQ